MEQREEELVFWGLRKLGREGLDSSKYRGLRPQQVEAGLMHRTTRKKDKTRPHSLLTWSEFFTTVFLST